MPELPEVQTTVNGLREKVIGLIISDVWSDYNSLFYKGSDNIKDPKYFTKFKKQVIGKKVISADRRAKNILITLEDNNIILVHLKMTGHLMYGKYKFNSKNKTDPWEPVFPESLKDSYNRHVHFLIIFSNKKHLALSDVRKFAKVTLIHHHNKHLSNHLSNIGPEPLEGSFKFKNFLERIEIRPTGKIKLVLMDQSIIAGIGNIYADESLWRAGIHPSTKVSDIEITKLKLLFTSIKKTLLRGIDFGGDSTSDYRNINGDKGEFHESHHAYQRTDSKCDKTGCEGIIQRIVIGGRSTHFCNSHQTLKNR